MRLGWRAGAALLTAGAMLASGGGSVAWADDGPQPTTQTEASADEAQDRAAAADECSTVCYVDASSGADTNDGTTPATAKQTIQAAVTSVSPNGSVQVAAGTYTEPVTVAKDGVSIIGAGASATVLRGASCTGNGIALTGSRDGFTVRDLSVTNFAVGVYLGVTGDTQSDVTIENVTTSANCNHGIHMQAGTVNDLTIDNVTASNNGPGTSNGRGIWLINGVKTGVNITNSVVSNNGLVGIDISDGSVTGLTVVGNTVQGNGDAGISVLGARGPEANLIDDNTVRNNGRYGIELKNSAGTGADSGDGSLVVSRNVVERTVAATDARDYAGIAAIRRQPSAVHADQPAGAVIVGNEVRGFVRRATGSTGDGFGIVVEGLDNAIRNNIVAGNNVGVQVQGTNPTPNAQSTPYFDRGDAAQGSATVTANSISGNDIGLRTLGSNATSTLDATSGWWGSKTGPQPTGAGDSVVTSGTAVVYAPWLCSGRDTSTDAGFQPNARTSPCGPPPPYTVVRPNALDGWSPANVRPDATVGITSTQPRGDAPDNLGSLEFTTNSVTNGQDKADFVNYWGVVPGRTLGNLSELSYELYRASSSTTAQHHLPAFRLAYATPSGDTGLLVWENVYNGGSTGTAVPTNQWISKDILAGNFWMRAYNSPSVTIERFNVTLADWQDGATFPGSDVLGPDTYIVGIEIGVGSGWGGTFRGFVDNVAASFTSSTIDDSVSANFEPAIQCTTACYVDASGGDDANGGTSAADAKRTIQAAVDTVSPGGSVQVAAGTYSETVTVDKDGLSITGAGTASTVINSETCQGAGITLTGSRNGLTVENLTITGFNDGIYLGVISDTQTDVKIEDVNVSENCRHGIYMQAGTVTDLVVNRVTASDNGTTGSGGRGIWVINGVKSDVRITDSVFSGNALSGIDFGDGNVTGLTVTGNTVEDNGDAGISVLGARGPNPNLIDDNTVRNNGRYGIEVKASNGSGSDSGAGSLVISRNVVERTEAATDPRDSAGIAVIRRSGNPTYNADQPAGAVVVNNEVRGFLRSPSGSTGDGFGIVVEGANNSVTNNIVAGNNVGIQVQGANVLPDLPSTPFFDRGNALTGSAVVNLNSISGNGVGLRALGVVLPVPLNAERNWWGSGTGPTPTGTGDGVVGAADYDPWLCRGTDTSAATGFQPNPQTSPCAAAGAVYTPQNPTRVLDTRTGTGAPQAKVGPQGSLVLQVTGPPGSGLAPIGSSAVTLNVTATDPSADTYISVYPSDYANGPDSSNLNVRAGETIANLVTTKVSPSGTVTLLNFRGTVDLVADLQGSYSNAVTGSFYTPQDPRRILDTRDGVGAPQARVGQGGTITLQVTGPEGSGLAPQGSTAVAINVTATNPSEATYVSVYPTGYANGPSSSNLNVVAGQTLPNLVVTKVAADGTITLYNNSGDVDLVADLQGAFSLTGAASYTPQNPRRILDTRNGTGAPQATVGPRGTITLQVTGPAGSGLAPIGSTAVVLNLTATNATSDTYVAAYRTGYPIGPDTSVLNVKAGHTVPNLVVARVAADGTVTLYNYSGSVDLVADLQGAYTAG
jgi:hypothetical protein